MNKRQLYESIMTNVAKEVKRALNEEDDYNYSDIHYVDSRKVKAHLQFYEAFKKFKFSGKVKEFTHYANYKPVSIDFDTICLMAHKGNRTYFYSVSFIKNNLYAVVSDRVAYMDIDKFAKKIVDGEITIDNKEHIKAMVDYYLNEQSSSYLKGTFIDTGITEYVKDKVSSTYEPSGNFKIDTQTLHLLLRMKNVQNDTIQRRKNREFGIGPIDGFLASDIRKLGKLFGLTVSDYNSLPFEGNEGYNFMSYCGICVRADGKIVKDHDCTYSKSIQDQVYKIVMKCISSDIPTLDEIYVTNYKDTEIPGKIGRNYHKYIEPSLLYLQQIIPNATIDSDYNAYYGASYIMCSFDGTTKNQRTIEKFVKVFNYKEHQYHIDKESAKMSICFNVKKLRSE